MIINLISGPRNISTALMYSFSQRTDTGVLDEPFYGYYLQQTGVDHPGREEVIATQDKDPESVIRRIEELHSMHEHVFVKNMAHHHEVMDWDYLTEYQNVFLIRDPKQLIASFARVIDSPTIMDIGLKHEAELLGFVTEHGKYRPITVDSNDILSDPELGLSQLCEQLDLPFEPAMLSWERGPIPEDGVWARYWYKNVHNSTGFSRQKSSDRALPERCQALYQEAIPYYEKLASQITNPTTSHSTTHSKNASKIQSKK